MQTVAEFIEELKKLPPDNVIDFSIEHSIRLKHFPNVPVNVTPASGE